MKDIRKGFTRITWLLLLFFLPFLWVIGSNTCLQTDDYDLLIIFRNQHFFDAYHTFDFNFRLGSYSLLYFLSKTVNLATAGIGIYYFVLFSFTLFSFYYFYKHFSYKIFENAKSNVFNFKLSFYTLLFLFFYSNTIQETWFWLNGSMTYFIPLPISLILFTLLVQDLSFFKIILISILSFYIGGASETFFLGVILLIGGLFIFKKLPFKPFAISAIFLSMPNLINVFTHKISNRISFEQTIEKTMNWNQEPSTLIHIETNDVFIFIVIFLVSLEFNFHQIRFKKIISYPFVGTYLFILGTICLTINYFVFQSFTPLRTLTVFNFTAGLMTLYYGTYFMMKIAFKTFHYVVGCVLCFSFFVYFFNQINITHEHKKAFLLRNEMYRKNRKLIPLPDSGITVYSTIPDDSTSFAYQKYKEFFYESTND